MITGIPVAMAKTRGSITAFPLVTVIGMRVHKKLGIQKRFNDTFWLINVKYIQINLLSLLAVTLYACCRTTMVWTSFPWHSIHFDSFQLPNQYCYLATLVFYEFTHLARTQKMIITIKPIPEILKFSNAPDKVRLR